MYIHTCWVAFFYFTENIFSILLSKSKKKIHIYIMDQEYKETSYRHLKNDVEVITGST